MPRLPFVLWLIFVGASGCDGGAPDGQPTCGTVQTRTDTVYARLGEIAVVDLSEGASQPGLTYTLIQRQTSAAVEMRGESGDLMTVAASVRGQGFVVVSGKAPCGEVERVTVFVYAVPAGAACTPHAPRSLGPFQIPAGGVPLRIPLWGEQGLFSGQFEDLSVFEVTSPPGISGTVYSVQSTAPDSLSIVASPEGVPGGSISVVGTDVCFRRTSAQVTVGVVDSPVCEIVDPAWIDLLPLSAGQTMTFSFERNSVAWEETWEVTNATPCVRGSRRFDLRVTTQGRPGGDQTRFESIEFEGNIFTMSNIGPLLQAVRFDVAGSFDRRFLHGIEPISYREIVLRPDYGVVRMYRTGIGRWTRLT